MKRSCSLRSRTSRRLYVGLVCAGLGCSSPEPRGAPASFEGPVDSPECTSTPKCDGPQVDGSGRSALCVQTVDADLVDEAGSPVSGFHAQICSAKVCMGAKSDAQGRLHFVLCKNMVDAALDIPGHAKFVTYAVPIERSVSALGPLTLVPLASGATPMSSASGADKTYASGGVVLVVPAGSEVVVDPIDHPEPQDQQFRAAKLDPEAAPGIAESSPGLTLFYGLAPTGTTLSKAGSLTLPNSYGWPAGAQVEFFVQGASALKTVPDANWTSIGAGRVSDDGETMSTDAGSGVTFINLIGVRLR